jgi:acyl transferase domain-containing protein
MEPIAILGMSCRFPRANNLAAFWQLLREGRDAIREVPADRWDANAFYDPDPAVPGKMSVRRGGFLDEVDKFDPLFFRISPREAVWMDPQQRLILELAWEALEDAGVPPARLRGSSTGVFLGCGVPEYQLPQQTVPTRINSYTSTGWLPCILSNRISYVFDFRGPSLSLDTACSSSLMAVHLACQSLQRRESTLALAGGISLMLSPVTTIGYSKLMALSPDGRCKTFDAEANGYARGEGGGIVVLKLLSEALKNGDEIEAVIRGTAVNQDGRTNGLTAPNRFSQEDLLRRAYASAGAAPGQVQYVEAHGTGTLLGDPIEAMALGAVLAEGRPPNRPCAIGSLKTNIGHLESAAGIAGLIKVVLAIRHRMIPPSLHFRTPNPHIPFDRLPLKVQQTLEPWPEGPALAGVSAFGFGGSNAHLVVSEAPIPEASSSALAESVPGAHLLPLSAHNPEALQAVARSYRNFLASQGQERGVTVEAICASTALHRSHHDFRLSIVADSEQVLAQRLDAFLAGQTSEGIAVGGRRSARAGKVAFLFTGQGAQYVNMGRGLYETQPVFRSSLQQCDEILRPLLDRSLLAVLYPEQAADSPLHETAYTQPALFALEYSLAQQWRAWGVEPAAVMGHSVGEYAAACVAGILSLEDALALIARRARLMHQLPRTGVMASVFADAERVRVAVQPYTHCVSLAALNGPRHTVVSGEKQAVQHVLRSLAAEGNSGRLLTVSHAFHSPLIEPALGELEKAARQATYAPARIPFISNLTGKQTLDDTIDASYWRRHARQPVQFAAGMQTLRDLGCELFVEIGPHPTLIGMAQECTPAGISGWLPSLRKGREDWQQMLESLGQLYVHRVAVDWNALFSGRRTRRIALPTYPFQRERFWWDQVEDADRSGAAAEVNGRQHPRAGEPRASAVQGVVHPLLGARLRAAVPIYQSEFDPGALPWLSDQRIHDIPVVPGVVWLEMALEAGTARHGGSVGLREVAFEEMLLLSPGHPRTVQFTLTHADGQGSFFEIYSATADADTASPWTRHARGQITSAARLPIASPPLSDLRFRLRQTIAPDTLYERLRERGLHYGPALRCIEQLWRRDREALGKLRLSQELAEQSRAYQFHPVLLDAAFQLVAAALPAKMLQASEGKIFIPTRLTGLCFHRCATMPCWGHVCIQRMDGEILEADLRLLDETGEALLDIAGLRFQSFGGQHLVACNRSLPANVPDTLRSDAPTLDREMLLAAEGQRRHDLLQAYLRKQLAHTLRLAESRLDVTAPLQAFGLDSLMLLGLGAKLMHSLGVTVKMSDLLGETSIATLSSWLMEKITQDAPPKFPKRRVDYPVLPDQER